MLLILNTVESKATKKYAKDYTYLNLSVFKRIFNNNFLFHNENGNFNSFYFIHFLCESSVKSGVIFLVFFLFIMSRNYQYMNLNNNEKTGVGC